MYDGDRIGVVVPAHNEARFIGEVLSTMPEFVDVVIVIDDCSDDGTWQVVRAFESGAVETAPESPPRVATSDGGRTRVEDTRPGESRIIASRHQTNRGRGAAVKTGYRLALNQGVDVVAVMDGDGQMDPDYLGDIIDPVVNDGVAYVKGNRLVDFDHVRQMSRWRLFGNATLTLLTKCASGYWGMRDPQNGYTAISASALEEIDISGLFDGYGFLNDLLVTLGAHDLQVVDVPVEAVYGDESSGIRYSRFVPFLSLLLLRGFLWRLWMSYGPTVRSKRRAAPDPELDE
jgi:glycosyltransferase involved in cell wall biosynthesis